MRVDADATEKRLAEVEAELAALRARMDRLEARSVSPASAKKAAPAPSDEDEIMIDSEKAEYLIGAQLLPRVGAVLIVLAIVLFAALGTSGGGSGSASLVLGIELLACLGFIAVGEWKRNELEGFGQVLTAIGAAGIFLSAASAHYAYKMVDLRGLAVLFVAAAAVNFSYATWKDARAFFVIGLLGGLSAAVLPAFDHDHTTASVAYVCVGLMGAVVAWRRAWPVLAITQWVLALGALVPLIASDEPWTLLIPTLYLGCLPPIAAYAYGMQLQKTPGWAIPAPLALFATGLIGFGMQHSPIGALHLTALAASAAACSLLLPASGRIRQALLIGAAATAVILIPGCFPGLAATVAYPALALAAWLVSRVAVRRLAAVYSILTLLFGAWAYSFAIRSGLSFAGESVALVVFAAGILGAALSFREAGWNGTAVACAGFWVLITKWTQVITADFNPETGGVSTSTLAWIVYALALLVLGFVVKSPTPRFWSFGVMFVTVCKVLLYDAASTSAAFKVAVLLTLGFMMLVGGYTYVRGKRIEVG